MFSIYDAKAQTVKQILVKKLGLLIDDQEFEVLETLASISHRHRDCAGFRNEIPANVLHSKNEANELNAQD